MRIVIQRCLEASVTIDGTVVGRIGPGMLVLVGVTDGDTPDDAAWLARKTLDLRIFNDENGVMNRSVLDCGGGILAVSQFTLYASTRKGNRPSYIRAARPETAEPLYDLFCRMLDDGLGHPAERGRFGADMKVALVNDGPVTIIIDSKLRE